MAAEINEGTKMKFGIGQMINAAVIVIGITISFITQKVTTQYDIDALKGRVEKIENVKPELLQWQLNSVNEKIEELKTKQGQQSELIQKIYDTLIK